VQLNQGPFGIDSRPALTGMKVAEAQGLGAAYHRAVMNAYWLDGRDISDRTVLAECAEQAGLEPVTFLAALDDPAYELLVMDDEETARQYGLNSVPAIVFAMRYLISGAQPYPVLVQATEQVMAELANDA
jgi:predicted DsbA family dithiol-disulfide isomerase